MKRGHWLTAASITASLMLIIIALVATATAAPSESGAMSAAGPIINEVDADTVGTDVAEFVELYDGGTGGTSLDGLVLVFYNGSDDASYYALDLDGYATDVDGYFVVCVNAANVANCDVDVPASDNWLQNGADAVALHLEDETSFPNDTPVTTDNLVDAIVYDTDESDDAALLVLLNAGQPQLNENGAGNKDYHSNQRCPNGSGGERNTDTYVQNLATPGTANLCAAAVTVSKTVFPDTNVLPGSVVTFTVQVDNPSGYVANGVIMTDGLPVEADFVSWVISATGTVMDNDVINWSGDIPIGDTAEWIFAAEVTGTLGSTVTNTARVDLAGDLAEAEAPLTFMNEPTVAARLLLSELVVTPTAGEFVEIYNPNDTPVDLSMVYLTDATFAGGGTYYYNIVTGSNAGGGSYGDFHAIFPEGAMIEPGEYQTIALAGSEDFSTSYGVSPTYELYEDAASPDGIPDMREALLGSISGQGGLTNDGEVVILYFWDGASDLVTDLDYAVYGDKAEAVDKTSVSIDGPDADVITSTYLADTAIAVQDVLSIGQPHDSDESSQRGDLSEGAEVMTGGNGIAGNDETSEDLGNTWCADAPTPNKASICALPQAQSLLLTEFVVTPTAGEFVEIYNPTGAPVDLSYVYLTDATMLGAELTTIILLLERMQEVVAIVISMLSFLRVRRLTQGSIRPSP